MSIKTIEEMAHEYVVAHIQSGKPVLPEDIKKMAVLARDVKYEAKRIQKSVTEDEQRRRW